ncbi:hypothetical protein D9M69_425880 [compost metagenome]
MADHHPLGLPGAARGVLQEGQVLGPPRGRQAVAVAGAQLGHLDDRAEARHLRLEQAGEQLGLGHGDQQADLGVGEDAGLAQQMLLDLRQAQRRVDRHRHAAGQQGTEEAEQEVAPGRQHQRHPLPGAQAAPLQAAGDAQGALAEAGVADLLAGLGGAQQVHVGALRVALDVPVEHLDEGLRRFRAGRVAGVRRPRRDAARQRGGRTAEALQHGQQVGRRLGQGEQFFRQAHGERLLDARPQLDPRQAVQAQVAVEHAVQIDAHRRRGLRAQLRHGAPHDVEQTLGGVRIAAAGRRQATHRRPLARRGHSPCPTTLGLCRRRRK